jgi:hypothetical protein
MNGHSISIRDLLVSLSIAGAGAAASLIARRAINNGNGATPLSPCEQDCIASHPDDTQTRLNCMLKCMADGKLSVIRTISIQ